MPRAQALLQAIVAVDSSKFKAVNSRDRNFTPGKIDGRQRQIEESIHRYLQALDTADRTQRTEVLAKTERLQDKIKTLRERGSLHAFGLTPSRHQNLAARLAAPDRS